MTVGIQAFEVVVDQVNPGQESGFHRVPLKMATGLQGHVDAVAFEPSHHTAQIIRITGGFAAAEGDPAAGMVEKAFVLKQALNELGGLIIAPFDGHGPGGARFGASAAGIALPAIDLNAVIQGDGLPGADAGAIGASDATPGLVEQFGTV
jgi:hypothetical protein